MKLIRKGVRAPWLYLVTLSVHDLIVLKELAPDVKEV